MGDPIASAAGRERSPSAGDSDRDIDEAQGLLLRMLTELDDPRLVAIVKQSVEILEAQRSRDATGRS
jgi:hypothetical protein